jgi:hypothetical protein
MMLTAAVEVASRFPMASWIDTTTEGLSTVPAIPFAGGCVVNTSLYGAPNSTCTEVLVAFASPVETAVSV